MSARALRAALICALVLVAGAALLVVIGHERTLARGQVVLAELAPVDPRSLMQGDYMALRFAIDAELRGRAAADQRREVATMPRYAHLAVDSERRATLAGLGDTPPPADSELVAIRIRTREGLWSIGPNAFFFEEGSAEQFESARWGEFRVDASGKALLTHLRDGELERLGEIVR